MELFFGGYVSLSKGYNVLNECMFQSHLRFCRMQWLPTRFYGSLSVTLTLMLLSTMQFPHVKQILHHSDDMLKFNIK